ncbi:MAG: siphovirus Gp157 family protein [Oscillospiraceae bacterium]|jgi:hypothetical protein|nr:siphovirus Gp157 family protein [Oscillospiraceae bacterium]
MNTQRKINVNKIEKLKCFLEQILKTLEEGEIETRNYRINFRTVTKLKTEDEESFKKWVETHSIEANDFLKFEDPKVDKNKLKKLLLEGKAIPLCKLVQNEALKLSGVKAKETTEGERFWHQLLRHPWPSRRLS